MSLDSLVGTWQINLGPVSCHQSSQVAQAAATVERTSRRWGIFRFKLQKHIYKRTYIYIYICNHPEVDRKLDLQRKVHFSDFSENVWKFHIHPYSIYSGIGIFIQFGIHTQQ